MEHWSLEELERELPRRDRIVVYRHVPSRASFLKRVDAAAAESSVPFARVDLPSRSEGRGRAEGALSARGPALCYHEHGEELERAGPTARELEAFIAAIEALQEQWRVIRGRLRVDRFG